MEAHVRTFEERAHLPKIKLQSIVMLAVLLLAIHILLPQVGELRHSIRAIERSDWWWLLPGLMASIATFCFAAVTLRAASGHPLPFVATVQAQLASSFANRLAPGSVGGLGVNTLFLTKQGLSGGAAGATLALNGLAGVMVHIVALLLAGVAAQGDASAPLHRPKNWELIAGFAVVLAVAGIIWRIPRLQSRILPALKDAWRSLTAVVRRPGQAATLFGGAFGITASYTLAFWFSLEALHVHASFGQAAFVYLGGAVVSSVAPTPGGLGAMEAALVAGLTHVTGATEAADGRAVAAVLTFRLLTYWLPILPGYLSLRHLRRVELL
jgi:undecaprenyl-diphosphatase